LKDKVYIYFCLISEYALYGILFFLPISIALVESFMGLALFGFVGRKIIKPDLQYLKFWPNIFLLLFLLFSAFSLLNSGVYLHKSLNALFGKWLQYLGICFILQDSIFDQKITKRAMIIFLSSAFLAVLSGLSQYFIGVEFLRHKSIYVINKSLYAVTSSFDHYNSFGGYLVIVLSLVYSLLMENSYFNLRKLTLLIFSMISTVAIILTFSRGSWFALALSFIFVSLLSKKNFKWLIPILFVIILMFLSPYFYERILLTFKPGGDSNRFVYWLTALKMIREHPFFGIGVGTYMANFLKYVPGERAVVYAHNCYLQIWAETGVFSLVSFLLFIGSLIYFGVRKFFASKDFLLLGLLSGLVGFLVHSFFEVNLYSLRLAILFWVWAGLLLGRLNDKLEKKCI